MAENIVDDFTDLEKRENVEQRDGRVCTEWHIREERRQGYADDKVWQVCPRMYSD